MMSKATGSDLDQYNIATIRSLLQAAFTARDLWRFCQERPEFRPVMADFGFNPALSEMIDVLLEYCRTRALVDELLAEIRTFNPRQYERYQAQLHGDGTALPPAPQIPHNLPPRSEFVGREVEKARIHEALRSRYFLISIDGIGGIGKTSLALEVAYECLHASQSDDPPEEMVTFDSFVWATAKDRELTLNVLLDAIALTLDYPGIVQRPLDQKRSSVERLLREKPCLLIVDNFETISDAGISDFLRYLPEPSKALITTREQKLIHSWSVTLKGLEEKEALELIRSESRRLDLEAILYADEKTLVHLHAATGGAPLAIKWAVGQIKQRGQSLDSVITTLHEAKGSVFEEVFARSWDLLSTQASTVLLVMPLFATSASREAIEATSDLHHFILDEALGQLVEMSLVDASDELQLTTRRYSLHPLTRAFTAAKMQQNPDMRSTLHHRFARYYEAFAAKHGESWKGFSFLKLELPNILTVIEDYLRQKHVSETIALLGHVSYFMLVSGFWNELMHFAERGVNAAMLVGDEGAAAKLRVWPISSVHRHRGNLDEAEQQLLMALTALTQDDLKSIAYAKRNLAQALRQRGAFDQVEALLRDAQDAYRALDEEWEILYVQGNLAELAFDLGEEDAAWELGHTALARARQTNDPELVAYLLKVLGNLAFVRGAVEQAQTLWDEALTWLAHADSAEGAAVLKVHLAQADIATGKVQSAKERLLEALDAYHRLDAPQKVQEVTTLLAKVDAALNQNREQVL